MNWREFLTYVQLINGYMLISELRFLNYQSNLDVPAYCFLIRIYANPSAHGPLIYFDPLKSIFDFGRMYTAKHVFWLIYWWVCFQMRLSLFHVNILVIFNLVTILMQGTLYNLQWKIACKAVSSICENIHFLMLDLASAPTTAILQGHASLRSPVARTEGSVPSIFRPIFFFPF